MTDNIFLARQPILDRDRRTFGYELLYRAEAEGGAGAIDDPDLASRTVIERVMLDWGMEHIIGDRFGFINASASLMVGGLHRALPPEGIIIEIGEDRPPTTEELEVLTDARRNGFHFALDNVDSMELLDRSVILPIASMVKVELSTIPPALVAPLAQKVKERYPGAILVAEKVETSEQFDHAMQAGYDLFQGYHFSKPEILKRSARPASATSALALLAALRTPDVTVDEIEELVGSDPSLAFRILHAVNSSAFGLNRRVESIRHAVVLIGMSHIRDLAILLTLSAAEGGSAELVTMGAVRAHLAGALASGDDVSGPAFTAGLLSVTPALYKTPMEVLLEDLPVTDEIRNALLEGTGEIGRLLDIAVACEQLDVGHLEELAPGRATDIRVAYLDAIAWADGLRDNFDEKPSRVKLPDPVPGTEVRAPEGATVGV
jgi:EAL and modified HD-GYP domain-containing signal transduction protein